TGLGVPVTDITYNIWQEPEVTQERVSTSHGTQTRTTTTHYDSAGRVTETSVESSTGTPAPPTRDEYSATTGALVAQKSGHGGAEETLTTVYDKLGQLESYIDADRNESTFRYDIDGRLETISDGKGSRTYSYDS